MSSHCRLLIARATKLIKYLKLWKLKRIRKTLFPVFSLYYFQPTCSCYLRSIPLSLNLNKEYYAVPVLLCCPNYSFKSWSSISTQVKIISLIKSDPMRSCMLPPEDGQACQSLAKYFGMYGGAGTPQGSSSHLPCTLWLGTVGSHRGSRVPSPLQGQGSPWFPTRSLLLLTWPL